MAQTPETFVSKVTDRFLDFLTRSLVPSSIFFVLLAFNHYYFGEIAVISSFYKFITGNIKANANLVNIASLFIILFYGYINYTLCQIIDNCMKHCFATSKRLTPIREMVKQKLTTIQWDIVEAAGFTDYNLSQVIGRKIPGSKQYVDDVRVIHSISLALSMNILIYLFFSPNSQVTFLSIIISVISIIAIHLCGVLLAKSRYRRRNFKMYSSFLLEHIDNR